VLEQKDFQTTFTVWVTVHFAGLDQWIGL